MEEGEIKEEHTLQGKRNPQGLNTAGCQLEYIGLMEREEEQRKKKSTDDVDSQRLEGSCLEEGEIEDSPDENFENDAMSSKYKRYHDKTSRCKTEQSAKRYSERHFSREHAERRSQPSRVNSNQNLKDTYRSRNRNRDWNDRRSRYQIEERFGMDQHRSSAFSQRRQERSQIASTSNDFNMHDLVDDDRGRERDRLKERTNYSEFYRGYYRVTHSTSKTRQPSSTFSRAELEHDIAGDSFGYSLTNTQHHENQIGENNNYSHQNVDSAMKKDHKRKWQFEDDQGWIDPNKQHHYNDAKRRRDNGTYETTQMGDLGEHNKRRQDNQRDILDTVSFLTRPCHSNNDVVTTLANRNTELQIYLKTNDECPKLSQLLTVLKKCAKANNLHKTCKLQVMQTLRSCKFFERKDVIERLKEPDISQSREETSDLIENVLSVLDSMVQLVGLEERDASIALALITRSCETLKDVNQKIKKWIMKIEDFFTKKRAVVQLNKEKIETFANTLPILPDIESIRSRQQVVIPKQQVTAGFSDELSYISYMYVLLREDFVRPLVQGIRSYIDHQEKRNPCRFDNSDVRCYEEVEFLSTSTTFENGIVWRIQLNLNLRKKSRIPSILQYGSLLCLSHDGFQTIHYATVANRKLDLLRNGQIEIKFVDAYSVCPERRFVMIESRAFYESCSHTLKYLKQVSDDLDQHGSLPMGKYLIKLTNEIDPPKYVEEFEKFTYKSLRSYGIDNDSIESSTSDDDDGDDDEDDNSHIDFYGENLKIPSETEKMGEKLSAKAFGLDTSQYEALQLVLNNEIALVQGPPGTGKTMMGVRIAEYFLANRQYLRYHSHLWGGSFQSMTKSAFVKRPLLLVSYTNHALDQFLQLLLGTNTMRRCFPRDVVRVGSRCEVEQLQKFMLKMHRRSWRQDRRPLQVRMRKIDHLKMINSHFSHLVHEQTLIDYDVIVERHIWQLQNTQFDDTVLLEWLDIRQFRHSVHADSQKEWKYKFEFDADKDELFAEDKPRLLDNDDALIQNEEVSPENLDFKMELALTHAVLQEHPDFRDLNEEEFDNILQGVTFEIAKPDIMSYGEMCNIEDIWELENLDRWRLYRHWVNAATVHISETIRVCENEFNTESQKYIEARNSIDLDIMKTASIVAMTTTAAARYSEVLKELAAPIIIIEEAAQVSEQHVLSTMSAGCQHLIMIGDHQQLKPAYNDYSLTREYHTDVSLFERLVRNQFPYKQLQKQHRMRPEISALLVPHIYKKLDDDESVFTYPDVRGMASNVYFVSHNKPEDNDDESFSHSNRYEAEYLSQLYRYLRLQGYRSSDITVLTMYKDQVKILKQLIGKAEISNITDHDDLFDEDFDSRQQKATRQTSPRITSVDNFQGEENKIILLSLVRSNKKGKIGYLATENRVCVSLSRAKEGLYVIGNIECIRKHSPLWENIISKAESNGACGKSLELKCKKHPSLKMMVLRPVDFEAFKDGGCSKPCTTRLKCGHACPRLCHNFDEEHTLPCQKLCVKKCPRGHEHNVKCNQELKCTETVTVVLQTCGHEVETECYLNIFDVECTNRCENIMKKCGHRCQRKCGERCNREQDCNELVKVTGKCGHTNQVACREKMSVKCRVPCQITLDCGHPCKGTCGKCHSGRLHVPCQLKCTRKLICGHICGGKCTQVCPPCTKRCEVACKHSKCDDKCGEECINCNEPCSWECKKNCKNKFKCTTSCHEICNRTRCNIPCGRILKDCAHRHRDRCIGLQCAKECICRRCSDPENFEIFFGSEDDRDATFYKLPDCGHLFEVKALDQYMDMPSETVGMKVCPRCTTQILKAERYNNIIKLCHRDIKNVKNRLLSKGQEYTRQKDELRQQIASIKSDFVFRVSFGKLKNIFQVESLKMQIGFYRNVTNLLEKVKSNRLKDEKRNTELVQDLNNLLSWVLLERFRHSDQETREFAMELRRLRYCYRVSEMQERMSLKDHVPEDHSKWVQASLDTLYSGSKLNEENADQIGKELTGFQELYPSTGIGITEDERIMILKAMDFREKGHWYKCKNGHVYAIGDCGGATVESRCPECEEIIGGGSHRLREDNDVAREMDGARYSAWSEQANMENYAL